MLEFHYTALDICCGEVSEWTIEAVSKTVGCFWCPEGSNPSLSAIKIGYNMCMCTQLFLASQRPHSLINQQLRFLVDYEVFMVDVKDL